MNRTTLAIGIAILMLAIPATATKNDFGSTKEEVTDEIGVLNASCPLGAGTTVLTEGVPVTSSLPAISGASCEFSFSAAAGADVARIVLSGLSSDFDLYTRLNAMPTTSLWNCRPYSGGTTVETCDTLVNAGDYVGIMVRRFLGSGGFTVTATSITIPTLENGIPVTGSSTTGSVSLFKLVVPAGSTAANFLLVGPSTGTVCEVQGGVVPCSPDADLYVRVNNIPTTASFSCRPYPYGTVEACTFNSNLYSTLGGDPAGLGVNHIRPLTATGKYFVMVRGFAGSGDWLLQGTTA